MRNRVLLVCLFATLGACDSPIEFESTLVGSWYQVRRSGDVGYLKFTPDGQFEYKADIDYRRYDGDSRSISTVRGIYLQEGASLTFRPVYMEVYNPGADDPGPHPVDEPYQIFIGCTFEIVDGAMLILEHWSDDSPHDPIVSKFYRVRMPF